MALRDVVSERVGMGWGWTWGSERSFPTFKDSRILIIS